MAKSAPSLLSDVVAILPSRSRKSLVESFPEDIVREMEAVKAAFLSGQIQATKSGLAVAMSKSLRSRGITISECTVVRWLEKT